MTRDEIIIKIMAGDLPKEGLSFLLQDLNLTREEKQRIIYYWFCNNKSYMINNYLLDFIDNNFTNIEVIDRILNNQITR